MKKRVLSLLLVCSMILSMFAGLSVTAFAADAESDFIMDDTDPGLISMYNGDGGDVEIPDTIDGHAVTGIDGGAFDYDIYGADITSITIPATVVSIGAYTFGSQYYLESVTFYGHCTYIDEDAFDSLYGYTVHCTPSDKDYYTFFSGVKQYLKPAKNENSIWKNVDGKLEAKGKTTGDSFTLTAKESGELTLSVATYYTTLTVKDADGAELGKVTGNSTKDIVLHVTAGVVLSVQYSCTSSSTYYYCRLTAISFEADEPVTQPHTITATAGANGTIAPNGEVKVEDGANQTFTVTADDGYTLDTLTVDGAAASLTNGTYTFNNVTADHTISATFKEAPAVDLFQKFFENCTGLTAVNSTDKPWSTNATSSRLIASGADSKVFTLTAAADGYLTVAVECKGALTSLTLTSSGKTLEQITPVIAPYTTTKVVSVKANEPITFTYVVIQRSKNRTCSSLWNQCSPPGMTVRAAPAFLAKAEMVSGSVRSSCSPYKMRVGTRHASGCART